MTEPYLLTQAVQGWTDYVSEAKPTFDNARARDVAQAAYIAGFFKARGVTT